MITEARPALCSNRIGVLSSAPGLKPKPSFLWVHCQAPAWVFYISFVDYTCSMASGWLYFSVHKPFAALHYGLACRIGRETALGFYNTHLFGYLGAAIGVRSSASTGKRRGCDEESERRAL